MRKIKPAKQDLDNVYSIMHTTIGALYTVIKMSEFELWLGSQPPKTKAIVLARLDMIAVGHFGDHKRFDGLVELRWKNGIRVYAFFYGRCVIVVLYGGNKNAQNKDIKKAKRIKDEIINGTRTI